MSTKYIKVQKVQKRSPKDTQKLKKSNFEISLRKPEKQHVSQEIITMCM